MARVKKTRPTTTVSYLPADYVHSTGDVYPTPHHNIMVHYRICPCKLKLYRCIRITQDASFHLVQIDLSVQVPTVSCKTTLSCTTDHYHSPL